MLVTSTSVSGFRCTTPAASSWRTLPSQPRESPRSRELAQHVRLSFSAFRNATAGRAFYCRPPHGNTFNQGVLEKRGSLEPRSRNPLSAAGFVSHSRRQLFANAAI